MRQKTCFTAVGRDLRGVGGFGGGQADEFGASKCKGGGDEDGAEAFETVAKGAGVAPGAAANVFAIGAATAVDDDAENDVADDGGDFDDGEDEFSLTEAFDAKQVDGDDEEEEDGDKGVAVDFAFGPVFDG